ncbi:response regulator [Dictyobacter kobayashii]|uniref:Response regulator n=1 Tax=Dictyobacter kobayashii TaxID=2014872 RepID=A0A402AL18_9CHLR|nr:response regulator [Dictyobacter kobayashii]GCE19710.1 response regulator [Dictyobacter kobayashii]
MDKSQQIDHQHISNKYILIVDDDPILGNLLLEALDDEAYQALHVLSGEMAQNVLQRDVPVLLLLDYHLPGMNGLELAYWLKSHEEYRYIPIILMSADVPPEANCKMHLRTVRKPFDLERLLQLIAELIASGVKDDSGVREASVCMTHAQSNAHRD